MIFTIFHNNMRKYRKVVIIFMWMLIWQLAASLLNRPLLLPGPIETIKVLAENIRTVSFYRTIGSSLFSIAFGFFTGFLAAVLLAVVSHKFSLVKDFLSPLITLMKAIPVASFVVILLIWWGAASLSKAVSFLIVMPQIYISTLEGLYHTDQKILEMAEIFRFSSKMKYWYIYRKSLGPFIESGIKIGAGMSFKSGVAAELIGSPAYSIGERLYMSKIHLNTESLFAWTLVIILISAAFEKIVFALWNWFVNKEPQKVVTVKRKDSHKIKAGEIVFALKNVSKKFDEKVVLNQENMEFRMGETYFLTNPSGAGKTTILRLLAGLESADFGEVMQKGNVSMVFQEDRLLDEYSGITNITMVSPTANRTSDFMELLEEDVIKKPCGKQSGGQKRRTAILRAMNASSDAVLLDEPFTGLDDLSRKKAIEYIKREQRERCLIIATHNKEDIKLFAEAEAKAEAEKEGKAEWKKELP
ncbi:ATP-binding cassette domain-containing protein [Lachnospiraceae bacterium OttesenSCG-928-D06]|nr:ATP-binding cassette domain-containing protein [Lachnospiraceae bacterium OttesenSCG-928-D06]